MRYILTLLVLFIYSPSLLAQQPQKPTTSEIYHNLQKLNFVGSAMYIAAHPDDENTRLISYLSNDVKARTAYLSLTRGDGGQNLIGPEIRELLGVIRTQELIAARKTDGGEQLFTRANDFGYSKHPDETLAIWNKKEVLSDVVRAIRKFKPDIIINRFNHRNPGTTHGHHTSSAMLSFEAFDLVGNTAEYPETVKQFGAWQPKRLFFNTSWWFYGSRENFEKADKSNILELETGTYYTSLGLSNGEIASLSRSMHKSQGFGSTGSRGSATEYLEFLKGDFSKEEATNNGSSPDLFAGINTTWSRLDGGKEIGAILEPLEENFNFKNPASMLPDLLKVYELVRQLEDDHWRTIKKAQLEQLILDCGGIFLEAVANTNSINPKGSYQVSIEAINRSNYPVVLQSIKTQDGTTLSTPVTSLLPNERSTFETNITSSNKKVSTPYWLNEKGSLGMYKAPSPLIGKPETPAPEKLLFTLQLGRSQIDITRDVVYKYNDPVDGEVYQPLEIVPEITTSIPEKVLIFADDSPKQIPVVVKAGKENISGFIQLNHPDGWTVSPAQQTFELSQKGEEKTVLFTVIPPKEQSEGFLKPLAVVGDVFYDKELFTLDYNHIPYQRVLLPSEAKIVRIPIEKKGEHIGYIEGAGDAIPESLKQIGYQVTTIVPNEITLENLQQYDAIVVGIRAYNTIPELAFKQNAFRSYTENGGTLILQYNTNRRMVTEDIAPYPLKLSRDRVTDEFSEVKLLAPKHPVLNEPNIITEADFEGWVQERGLYFPNEWDAKFTPILGMSDENSTETKGSLLVTKHGKGYYIYTGLSFFRELPAGVPGAYRLFANLLSLGN
ncbi:PIG-L family deacetylase [Patiriisocius hiemis]|uniref:PIG-L family deacetylase n=1 Tax=Patiriisocius hiemis TaxID=3075604 RepID=A0ABU2YA00_9FLAO|nr:PIG-L family deacetylase [Constantimarinum sp. W242]MDT0555009.1 PIG-L family deacetylase [Constantimarinum sp. W242]